MNPMHPKARNLGILQRHLRSLPQEDRAHYLLGIGYTAEEAENMVTWALERPLHSPVTVMPKQNDAMAETLSKIERRIALCKAEANAGLVSAKPDISELQKDIAHNQFLMNGSTLLDNASYHWDGFQTTEISRQLKEIYGHGEAKHFALLCGDVESGKTFAAMAHVNKLAKRHFDFMHKLLSTNAMFVTAFDLARMVATRKYDTLHEIRNAGLLLIDDAGTEPTGYKGADFIAEFEAIISYRHQRRQKKTIITTNLEHASDDPEKKTFASVYGERAFSRIAQVGEVLSTNETGLRRK